MGKLRKLLNWLYKNCDKVLHFTISLLLAFIVGLVLMLVWHFRPWAAMLISWGVVFLIGVIKETLDALGGGIFDLKDLQADIIGLVLGGAMLLVAYI